MDVNEKRQGTAGLGIWQWVLIVALLVATWRWSGEELLYDLLVTLALVLACGGPYALWLASKNGKSRLSLAMIGLAMTTALVVGLVYLEHRVGAREWFMIVLVTVGGLALELIFHTRGASERRG